MTKKTKVFSVVYCYFNESASPTTPEAMNAASLRLGSFIAVLLLMSEIVWTVPLLFCSACDSSVCLQQYTSNFLFMILTIISVRWTTG
jgi:hypothetical protein